MSLLHTDKTNAALIAERDELYDIYKISPPVEIETKLN